MKAVRTLVVLTLILASSAGVARADTFLTFRQASGVDTMSFNNNGTSATLSSIANEPVYVNFNDAAINGALPTPLANGNSVDAHVVITAVATAPVDAETLSRSTFLYQNLDTLTIQFVATTPINGHTNLLTVTVQNGELYGIKGSSNVSVDNYGENGPPNTVAYTSDFLTFNPADINDNYFIAGTSDASPSLGVNADSLLNSFGLDLGTGQFIEADNNPTATPEPATMALLALGGVAALIRRRRGRK